MNKFNIENREAKVYSNRVIISKLKAHLFRVHDCRFYNIITALLAPCVRLVVGWYKLLNVISKADLTTIIS